jgi:Spy/CpxP family protein refolding chaperone
MKKRVTSVLIAFATVLLCSVSMFGQAAQPSSQSGSGAEGQPNSINDKDIERLRANLRANRKNLMAENMNLTADEATKFWPIFDQYRREAIKPNDERWALIKEYAANYNTMTDAQAQDYMKRATAVDQELLALRLRYVPVFEKVLSAKKIALWYQIDRHIDLMINLQLSSVIPMVDTTK